MGLSGFRNFTGSVILLDNITKIEDFAFTGCSGITKITLPNSLTCIYNGAFEGTSIQEIIIPKGITYISNGVFDGCKLLERIVFEGRQIDSIGDNTFAGCPKLSKIYYTGTESEFDKLLTHVGSVGNSYFTKDKAYFLTTKDTEPKPEGKWWYYEGDTISFENIHDSTMQ